MPISAWEVTVVGSVAVSLAVLTSLPPETVAVLVTEAGAVCNTVTVIVIAGYAALAANASLRVQVTVWPATPQLQPAPVAVDGVSPAGNVSETVTRPLDATGPTLVTSSWYVLVVPRTKGSACLFAIVRSGACPLTVALAESLLALGSGSFSAVLVAVLVRAPVVVTVAVSDSMAEPPLAIAPMSQTPVALV